MNEIKITTARNRTVFLHNRNGAVYLVSDRTVYEWDPEANGYCGSVEHGGNFLDGTEFRRPARGGGDWTAIVVPEYSDGSVIIKSQLHCRENDIPTLEEATEILESGRIRNEWGIRYQGECRNPEPGHNDEWIPAGYITTEEAASRIGKSLRRVQQMIQRGELRAVKTGRDWLIDPDDLARIPPPQKRGPKPKTIN